MHVTSETGELARLSELIDSIYQGATDPSHWNRVVPQIAEWLGARRGFLFTPLNSPENGGYYFSHEIPESLMPLRLPQDQHQQPRQAHEAADVAGTVGNNELRDQRTGS